MEEEEDVLKMLINDGYDDDDDDLKFEIDSEAEKKLLDGDETNNGNDNDDDNKTKQQLSIWKTLDESLNDGSSKSKNSVEIQKNQIQTTTTKRFNNDDNNKFQFKKPKFKNNKNNNKTSINIQNDFFNIGKNMAFRFSNSKPTNNMIKHQPVYRFPNFVPNLTPVLPSSIQQSPYLFDNSINSNVFPHHNLRQCDNTMINNSSIQSIPPFNPPSSLIFSNQQQPLINFMNSLTNPLINNLGLRNKLLHQSNILQQQQQSNFNFSQFNTNTNNLLIPTPIVQPLIQRNNKTLLPDPPSIIRPMMMMNKNLPVLNQSMNGQPIINQSIMNQPMVKQPMNGQPIINQPMINQPLVNQPMVKQPLVNQPMMKQPMINQPMVNQPLINPPMIKQPMVKQPMISQQNVLQQQKNQPNIKLSLLSNNLKINSNVNNKLNVNNKSTTINTATTTTTAATNSMIINVSNKRKNRKKKKKFNNNNNNGNGNGNIKQQPQKQNQPKQQQSKTQQEEKNDNVNIAKKIDEIKNTFGIDDEYMKRMEEQKLLREKIVKIKAEKRNFFQTINNVDNKIELIINDKNLNISKSIKISGIFNDIRESLIRKLTRPYGMVESIKFIVDECQQTKYKCVLIKFLQMNDAKKFFNYYCINLQQLKQQLSNELSTMTISYCDN